MSQCHTGDSVVLVLRLNPQLSDFKGHFPSYPILPGVTQIDWAVYFSQRILGTPTVFAGMDVIKFQEPIQPNQDVQLSLSWNGEKAKLHFCYTSEDEGNVVTHSSGRISLEVAQSPQACIHRG
ncbi:3-hydroxyacyl-ACP dehydratase [Photobacterium lutimaris]|uniref:3-hydroxyacyl-ACP dehydratase n=1 Tax=Photobacterium lutimaris TaxID=388278 RepID=A0A2T3J5A4_9GAMM|nr:3-hydroxyacyl-ACP dehydratase [Photobacterium lutimaris]